MNRKGRVRTSRVSLPLAVLLVLAASLELAPRGCAGTTRRMSVNSAGHQGNGRSYAPSISANGKYVAFNPAATNLVGKDTNAIDDIFIRGPLR